ncbi:MAG: hypothetical protein O2887_17875 [Bacteroidetes bacterium]|nr:hypothetical protein [Bacteroidota bacterium]
MNAPKTSFPFSGYFGPKYFCDRENETNWLVKQFQGGSTSVIIGIRRVGKTGLIKHLFSKLEPQGTKCIFVDLQGTPSFNELVGKLAGMGSYKKNEADNFI